MKIVNKFNLPQAIVNAVTRNGVKNEKRLSVTDLIGSPLVRQLKLAHWDELESDVSDMLWMLLGSATHYILEKGAPKSALSEQKIEVEKGGFTVVGVPDIYHDGVLSDFKITSCYSFILGDKPEWEHQLNVYAWLLEHCGFPVKKLEINAILRDWMKSKVGGDYPPIPFQTVNVPLWPKEKIDQYVEERVLLHSQPATECTAEEKWKRKTVYALTKNGNKRATKLFDSLEEANKNCGKGFSVITRPGEDVRCNSYCNVSAFCPYFKASSPALESEET